MATIRHLRMAVRSLPVVLTLVLTSVLSAEMSARPVAGESRVSTVAVDHVAPGDVAAGAAFSGELAVSEKAAVPAVAVPVVDRARWPRAQHVADVHGSRAPPAVVV